MSIQLALNLIIAPVSVAWLEEMAGPSPYTAQIGAVAPESAHKLPEYTHLLALDFRLQASGGT